MAAVTRMARHLLLGRRFLCMMVSIASVAGAVQLAAAAKAIEAQHYCLCLGRDRASFCVSHFQVPGRQRRTNFSTCARDNQTEPPLCCGLGLYCHESGSSLGMQTLSCRPRNYERRLQQNYGHAGDDCVDYAGIRYGQQSMTDCRGDGCAYYTRNPSACGRHDIPPGAIIAGVERPEFSASTMCCACQHSSRSVSIGCSYPPPSPQYNYDSWHPPPPPPYSGYISQTDCDSDYYYPYGGYYVVCGYESEYKRALAFPFAPVTNMRMSAPMVWFQLLVAVLFATPCFTCACRIMVHLRTEEDCWCDNGPCPALMCLLPCGTRFLWIALFEACSFTLTGSPSCLGLCCANCWSLGFCCAHYNRAKRTPRPEGVYWVGNPIPPPIEGLAKYKVVGNKGVKLRKELNPKSTQKRIIPKGKTITVLETREYNGRLFVRCKNGWASVVNPRDQTPYLLRLDPTGATVSLAETLRPHGVPTGATVSLAETLRPHGGALSSPMTVGVSPSSTHAPPILRVEVSRALKAGPAGFGMRIGAGGKVLECVAGSEAEKRNVPVPSEIIKVNGTRLHSKRAIMEQLQSQPQGKLVTVTFLALPVDIVDNYVEQTVVETSMPLPSATVQAVGPVDTGNNVVSNLTPNLAMDSWYTPGEKGENAFVDVQNPLASAGVASFMIEDL
eukprot:COSAG05_NODE_258_length_12741_cov_168.778279_15_plen_670_part_00